MDFSTFIVLSVAFVVVVGGSTMLALAISRDHARRKAAFHNATRELGLVEDPNGGAEGWRFLARGSWLGTTVLIGEREHVRMTREGPRESVWIEVRAPLFADLGQWQIQHNFLSGPPVVTSPARTGIPEFDHKFIISRVPPLAAHSIANLPWLNDETRKMFLESPELQEMRIEGRNVAVLLRWFEPRSLKNAVGLVALLTAWSAAQSSRLG